jgi:nicotinamidase-related amidase
LDRLHIRPLLLLPLALYQRLNLDVILRSNNIDMLLLTGILTQGVVLSTYVATHL